MNTKQGPIICEKVTVTREQLDDIVDACYCRYSTHNVPDFRNEIREDLKNINWLEVRD